MLQGVTIQLLDKVQTGVDAFNRPIYTEVPESVENVLVGQPSDSDVSTALDLTGKRVAYTLGIPKGDTHSWEDKTVILPAPFSGTFRTLGFSTVGIEANIPLAWNRKVMVERYG